MGRILIIGSQGAQGKRYQSILKHLKRDYIGVDVGDLIFEGWLENRIDGVILATPTHTHLQFLKELMPFKKPILCEKPITKDVWALRELVDGIRFPKLTMVMQYRHFLEDETEGETSYDYFRHGNDGLVWDCTQIIGLAKGDISLSEESPIWKCKINGLPLNIEQMDKAYIEEVQDWLGGRQQAAQELIDIHEKVSEYERANP